MSSDATYASAPFDHAKADIILRSSDNVYFRVFKLFLSLASPFFESLFDIPQPPQASDDQEIKGGLVVVPLAEDKRTLTALLCYCYPCTLVDDPDFDTFEDMFHVLKAAQKYSINAIEKKILSDPGILQAEPHRCFAIARQGGLQEETLRAAQYTLTQPLIPSWFEEINLITAVDLFALLTYHRECGDAVYALRTDMSWIRSHYRSKGSAWLFGKYADSSPFAFGATYRNCSCPRSPTPRCTLFESQSLQWLEDFWEETFVALRERPCRATVDILAKETASSVKNRNCLLCSAKVEEGMPDLSELLMNKVSEVVSQVRLNFAMNNQDV